MTGKHTWYWRLAAVAAAICLYLFVAPVQAGINQAVAVLARGDLAAAREYMLTFGWWGPVVSILLMVLQALVFWNTGLIWVCPPNFPDNGLSIVAASMSTVQRIKG